MIKKQGVGKRTMFYPLRDKIGIWEQYNVIKGSWQYKIW